MRPLPEGLVAAPLGLGEVDAVTAVWRACELHDDATADINRDDVVAFAQRPSFDFARDTVGVRAGAELVAFGVQIGDRITFVHVLPAYCGRGIGKWLMRWSQDAARTLGAAATSQEVSDNARAAIALLEAGGYERRWDSWAFELALEREPPAPVLPARYAIRDLVPGQDERAVHGVIQRAFAEWFEHEPSVFEDWAAMTLGRPGFAPAQIPVCVYGDEVAGALVLIEDGDEGWVDQVAVAREHRGHGLGRALLMHAFGQTWRRGGRRCALGTDSRTGARGLYEHVGMRVRKTFGEYAKQL